MLLAAAFVLGVAHAFGPDHLAVVSTFVTHRRRLSSALVVSLLWGLGHMTSILGLGLLVSVFAVSLPNRLESYGEFAVGVVLVCVGFIALRRSFQANKVHYHHHSHGSLVHAHLHSHAHGEEHYDGHAATFTGIVHGLAGALPALALVPVAVMRSPWLAGLYFLLFSVGVILGMASYCIALSRMFRAFPEVQFRKWVQPAVAAICFAMGIFWMIRTGLFAW